jgi:NitT/TauT family transport system substrate-binding protein
MAGYTKYKTRLVKALIAIGIAVLSGPLFLAGGANAQEKVRIALPTKTYYPTIVAETALRQKFFAKQGLDAELTVYKGGAEAFEALAANAADITHGSPAIVAGGRAKGIDAMAVAGASRGYYGWHVLVPVDSPIKTLSELAGKKVGITSAGSASDIIARWAMNHGKVEFTRVPLGGGGLVPNLLSKNVDAIVVFSPLSYRVLLEKQGRSLLDVGAEMPVHMSGVWIAPGKLIKEKPQLVQKTMNALYEAVAFLNKNKEEAVKLIAEIDELTPEVAAAEFEGNISRLPATGEMTRDWLTIALDLAKLVGMSGDVAVEQIFITDFQPKKVGG